MLKRETENIIKTASREFKVVLVTGPRQVGKTTILKEINQGKRNYVSLDNLNMRKRAIEDPQLFLQTYGTPLIIDEIQHAPNLFPYIKEIVDNSNENGLFWLTGSQQFKLMKNVSETLAGRVGIIEMNSLNYAEKSEKLSAPFNPESLKEKYVFAELNIFKNIFEGGMPKLVVDKVDRDLFFDSYIKTYLERDVRDSAQVGDSLSFYKFLISIAARTGEQLNYTTIADDCGVSVPTVKNWISILVASGIIYLLEPYSNNVLKRTTKMPKIIFMDTGLCAYLMNWPSAETLENSSIAGHFLETYVISEIIKQYKNNGKRLNIYYYRDKDKNEIDMILEEGNVLYPYEIKKTANPTKEMIKNFSILEKTKKQINSGGLICFYPTKEKLDDKHYIIPISYI